GTWGGRGRARGPAELLWMVHPVELPHRGNLLNTPKYLGLNTHCITETRRKQQCEGAQGGGNAFIPRHSCSSIFVVRLMLIPRSPCPPDQVGPPPAAPALQAATPLLRRRQA